ncbi:hypothetical protein COLO4_13983 [Corchorus olitorius]|uniref:Pentacotripeptide-repeat region of PRORP domain-containing protein n=1 Tax=Corchorus olitorius TaxID=93759 RepID=A0A1R3JU30_9ROSI|nr:hypothetical protein COLO4_13983 [Corchorus olitorius]
MSRAPSSIIAFVRQNPCTLQNPNTQIRNLNVDSKDTNFIRKEFRENQNQSRELVNDTIDQQSLDIVKQVCKITRTIPWWEETLLSSFPSVNFSDPWFFRELLKQQGNVLLSLRFFHWLRSKYEFSPDVDSCNVLFDKLVEAKACKAAGNFLEQTRFRPKPSSLECYLRCLSEAGLVEEAVYLFSFLNKIGYRPSIKTWNMALLACVKVGRNDLVWKLYPNMIDSGVVVDIDTVGCLIQTFCNEEKAMEGYQLLQQVLEEGLVPNTVVFQKLIRAFCKRGEFFRVSELLHTMIARNCHPDIYTYQELILGLCKKGNPLEGYRIFNDLKDRGYAPDRVMYTTMIYALCKIGEIGNARKLWFEMINKGIPPNEYTYNALIYGLCQLHDLEEAKKLHQEMLERGFGETTWSYNILIGGFCLHRRMNEAYGLFQEMPQKGIIRDLITFNTLIKGFCKNGEVAKGQNLLKELLAQGLQPDRFTYTPIIEKLCQVGRLQDAKKFLTAMQSWGIKPQASTHNCFIAALCKEGDVAEGMKWLVRMQEERLRPYHKTFEGLIHSLLQSDRLDDSLFALSFMFRLGYALQTSLCHSLVTRLCKADPSFVESWLAEILEINQANAFSSSSFV